MRQIISLMMMVVLLAGLMPTSSYSATVDSRSNVEYFILPDQLLGLTKETTDVDVKSIVASKLPYLLSDFEQMAEISDLARINMLVPLSIIYMVNKNQNEKNILNLQPGQLFPDNVSYNCDARHNRDHKDHEYEKFLNVCDTIVDSNSENILQYRALVMALSETRSKFDANVNTSRAIHNRLAQTNMATIVIQDVLNELISQAYKRSNTEMKTISNHVKKSYEMLSGHTLESRNLQDVRQSRLTQTEVVALLNSRRIGWPWKLGDTKCFNASHGAYASGTGYSAFDFGKCGVWGGDSSEIFDVHAIDEGVSIGFSKDKLFDAQCSSYRYIETRVGSNTIQYFYYHLNLTPSESLIGKTYQYQEKIGRVSNVAPANCGGGTGTNNGQTHLHLGIYVNNQEISLDQVVIGGWRYRIVNPMANVIWSPNYRICAVQMQKDGDVRVAKDWAAYCGSSKSTAIVNDFNRGAISTTPILTSPSDGHTTTDGLWPTLEWTSTSSGPFEIRVSRNSNFSDCVVCENVSGKSYRPSGGSADAWMRARTGTFYWRVRVTGGTWSAVRSFTNTNPPTWTPTRTSTAVSVVPSLQSPANGHTTTDGLWPTLSWNSTSNGPFEIRVSRNSDFSDCVVCENVSGKSYRPSGGSADAWMRARTGTFYWRVRVTGGTWSSGRLFINTSPPTWTPTHTPTTVSVVPSLQSPANGHTTTDGLWPTLSWNSTSNGPFEIRVSKNSNFSDCIVCENVSGKSYRPSGSGADAWMRSHIGTLYWRVRVVGGTWSSGRSFQNTIDITHTPSPTRSRTPAPHTPTWTPTRPPPTWTSSPTASPRPTDAELTMPVLSSPADGATDVSTKVELDWEDVTRGNVNRYEVEVCIETSRGSNNWNCDKYDTNGAESRWKVWDRTNKIFPQRKIRWRVNANDGTKDGPVSEWRYFQPRYTYPTGYTVSGDTLKLSISRESNDVTYQCKYNFGGFSGSSWSSVDKTSFSGSSCSLSISSMRSKGASSGRTVYWIITSDSNKTLGDFDGRENTDGRTWYFSMP